MIRRILVLSVCGLWLSGCTQAPPPPPPDTRAAEGKAIQDLEAQNMKDWAAKDVDKIAAFYAADANVYLPNAPLLSGASAIKAALKDFVADPKFTVANQSLKVEVAKSGDVGYTRGAYTTTSTDSKTKKVMVEKGKYVTVFKKQADGSWKAAEDIFNPDAPATPAK